MSKQEKKKKNKQKTAEVPFDYIEYPTEEQMKGYTSLCDGIDLQTVYSSIETELATQQSKRDQIIAFYLTILGLTASFVFAKDVSNELRFAVFVLLSVIGRMWSVVALRYRIYKEAYWIACRTVSMLYTVDRDRIRKPIVQHFYYRSMIKNFSKFVKDGRIRKIKVMKSNVRSAEFLMYMTLIFLTSLSIGLALALLVLMLSLPVWCFAFAVFVAISAIIWGVYDYTCELARFYKVVEDGANRSFNSAFQKAWQLHMFYNPNK